ncbi:hypothetical protein BFW01_g11149 [Lasiodiplodia theobromae]|uniref:Uncharacterized protein n=2 Tax=Lasiodiplodia TaxID=66739 RepID=A0A5N5DD23_9PEZI|nr:uncharacterized protein LTHEOB_10193 [Lasiodiplodia theobromae]KAB2575718.1 hypothetical protein DBV05_g5576 [Lasiodiplodia theobromae]KAF4539530.1 hypothetical protein LTHEOB_10193 [Lasiodiplodia theobromae]KAF9639343.1 hypothetical protein BFW01_g11149 [Lasiodiplodia theobromae]KAK0653777.1 hypothetical protein DIS24_g5811 [Lasiodiplodia hormozganensis]
MLRTLARRAAEPARPAFDIHSNPYKAKRLWPPDFSKLSPKHQFRLERKFRRRSQLKWARPRWKKFVNLTQWATISFVVIYGVLFMDWNDEIKTKGRSREDNAQPFQGVREWFRRTVDSIWSKPTSQAEQSQPSSRTAS